MTEKKRMNIEVLTLGEKEYNPVNVLKNRREITDYFKNSPKTTPDLLLFKRFINILWKRKHYDEALSAVEAALEKYPEVTDLAETKCEILYDAGYYSRAAEAYNLLYMDFPEKYSILQGFGESLYQTGRLDMAEQVLEKAVELKTWDPSFLMNKFSMVELLAKISYQKKNYKKALEYLDDILTVQPRPSKWQLYFKILKKIGRNKKLREAKDLYRQILKGRRYASRAARYELQGKLELAIRNYRKAIEMNPLEPHYYFCVGSTLENLPEEEYEFQFDEATAYYKTAFDMFPNNPFYAMSYVGNLSNIGEWGKAFEEAKKAALILPELMLPSLRYLSGMLGANKEFKEILRKSIDADPEKELSEIRVELALMLSDENNPEAKIWFEEAAEIYKNKIRTNPYDWRHYYDLALCYIELERFSDAHENLMKATELHESFSVKIGEKLFETLYRLEKYNDALVILEALVLSDPGDYEYLGKMGMCFFAIGEYEKAFEAFNRSILLSKAVPEYLYGAGISAALLGRTEDVINIVKDLLEIDSHFMEVIEQEPTFEKLKEYEEFKSILKKKKQEQEKKGVKPAVGLKKIVLPGKK